MVNPCLDTLYLTHQQISVEEHPSAVYQARTLLNKLTVSHKRGWKEVQESAAYATVYTKFHLKFFLPSLPPALMGKILSVLW